MNKISKSDVEHVATLARLEITEEEKGKFTGQLGSILENFEKLDNAKTDDVETIHQINNQDNIAREDEIGEKYDRKEMLANAPEQEDGFIKVKAVFDNE